MNKEIKASEKLHDGVICSLMINQWSASTKVETDELGDDIPSEVVRAMQDLILDKSLLKELRGIAGQAKYLLLLNSIPCPLKGFVFLPKSKIIEIDEKLMEYKKRYEEITEQFARKLITEKNNFKKKYPKLYKPEKYPTPEALKKKFHFEYNFLALELPKKNGILSADIYKREAAKFQKLVADMEKMTINLIGNMLFRRVESLSKQCKEGSINKATVNSVDEFLGKWDEIWSGHVDQESFQNIISVVKKAMKGNSSEVLKDSEDLRNTLSNKLDKVMNQIKKVDDIDLKRKIAY